MTNEEALRLAKLAEMSWPGAKIEADGEAIVIRGPLVRGNGVRWNSELIRLNPHPRAVAALEAALRVLAGEP